MEEKTLHRRDYLSTLDEEKLNDFLETVAPYIFIIIEFNSLEAMLDFCIKELMSDSEGRDDMVFVFLAEMSYSSKVTCLMNLYGQYNFGCDLKLNQQLINLETHLREAAKRRNQYAHGQWDDTSEDNYLTVKVKAKRDGVFHVYRKFEVSDMEADLEYIQNTQSLLDDFDEEMKERLNRSTPPV